jgi:hypothetical protein
MKRICAVVATFLTLSACDSADKSSADNATAREIVDLRAELVRLREDLSVLETKQKGMLVLFSQNIKASTEKIAPIMATVDATSKGFSMVRTEYGAFSVAIDDVVPFLDGYKIKLRVGNLLNATFSDLEITADWSDSCFDADGSVEDFEPCAEKSRKMIELADDLEPGTTTKIEIAFEKMSAEQLAALRIGLDAGTMALKVARP